MSDTAPFTTERFFNNVNNDMPTDSAVFLQIHREWTDALMDTCLEFQPDAKEVLVFGAGNCTDINIDHLADMFENIVLTDVDIKSLDKAYSSFDRRIRRKVTIKREEYTGLDSFDFHNTLFDKLHHKEKMSAIKDYVESVFKDINYNEILTDTKQFSVVLSTPVYTQIFYNQASSLLLLMPAFGYLQGDIDELDKLLQDKYVDVLHNYNCLLGLTCKDQGIIGCWTDVIEVKESSPFFSKLPNVLSQSVEERDRYFLNLASTHGLTGAVHGLYDLLSNIINPLTKTWWLWPFSLSKSYIVAGYVGRKK